MLLRFTRLLLDVGEMSELRPDTDSASVEARPAALDGRGSRDNRRHDRGVRLLPALRLRRLVGLLPLVSGTRILPRSKLLTNRDPKLIDRKLAVSKMRIQLRQYRRRVAMLSRGPQLQHRGHMTLLPLGNHRRPRILVVGKSRLNAVGRDLPGPLATGRRAAV